MDSLQEMLRLRCKFARHFVSRVILSSHMWVIKMPGSHLPATKRKDKNLEINEFARFLKVNCVVNMYWGNKTCQSHIYIQS